jgi:hypothetical protein
MKTIERGERREEREEREEREREREKDIDHYALFFSHEKKIKK